ncbi:hypothetical protein HanPI659440_Chr10g0366711 [Helianthus annuus]|nr:hypothetical protein HanPI659440_Chr10g0366711 [Helianthus annuus]
MVKAYLSQSLKSIKKKKKKKKKKKTHVKKNQHVMNKKPHVVTASRTHRRLRQTVR